LKKAYFNWSTGKDSALALYKILKENNYDVGTLVTTVNKQLGKVSMHAIPENLLEGQAKSIGLPLYKIYFSEEASMEEYSLAMKESLKILVENNYRYAVFGDIFLEDLKKYREEKLAELNLKAVFPLWKRDPKELITEFISLGFKAITVSVNANLLDESFVGRVLDENFINDLPPNVDVCGENGEFHTFVYDGPIFSYPIKFSIGEKVLKTYKAGSSNSWDTGFWYCNLVSDKMGELK
jgi:uncharacterized protein (TIGR00290 family)